MAGKLKLLIVLMFLGICTHVCAEEEEWVEVATADEFVAALHKTIGNTSKHVSIRLVADIDMAKVEAEDSKLSPENLGNYIFQFPWNGKISGMGKNEKGEEVAYALKNLKYTLFYSISCAEISDLLICYSSFGGRDTSSGMLADHCSSSKLTNLWFVSVSGVGDSGSYDCDRMGIAIGHAENTTFTNIMFSSCQLLSDGEYVGHAAGYAENCTFKRCVTDGQSEIWADGNANNAYAGGICGYADNCTLDKCINMSTVAADDDRIGGIIGYGTNSTTVIDCLNGGVIKHSTKDGFGRNTRTAHVKQFFIETGLTLVCGYILKGFDNYEKEIKKLKNTEFEQLLNEKIRWYVAEKGAYMTIMGAVQIKGELDKYAAKQGLDFDIALNHGIGIILSVVGIFAPQVILAVAVTKFVSALAIAFYNYESVPDEMGGIAGTIDGNTSIIRCVNSGPVTCKDDDCGGIVGHMENSTIESCYNRNFVRGKTDVGGIVGYCEKSVVKNCLNTAYVTSSGENGYYGITGNIVSCKDGDICNNYYLSDENKNHNNVAIAFTQEKLPSGEIAKILNDHLGENPIWRQNAGGENGDFYPVIGDLDKPIVSSIAEEGTYSIEQKITAGPEFLLACANPSAQITLLDNIDISGAIALLSTEQHPFRGHINGNGHTISNFYYQSSSDDCVHDTPHNIALFPYATGATFENFIIDGFNIDQKDETLVYVYCEGLLAGTADHCLMKNITIRNSRILYNNDDPKWLVGGLVGIAQNTSSSADDISYYENISVEATCAFNAYIGKGTDDAYLGGVVGKASKTVFDHCQYAGTLWTDDNFVGGICGYAAGCGFFGCLNTGSLIGQACVGGIVGRALSCEIKESVNTGMLCGDKGDRDNDYFGGIVGNIDGTSSVKYCLNFGEIFRCDEYCGGIEGKGYLVENVDCANNHWHYKLKGELKSDFVGADSFRFTEDDLMSGDFAYYYTNGDGKKYLYQYLDGTPFRTNLPVPIAAAGKVDYDRYCTDDYLSEPHYSNVYNNKYSYNEHYFVGGVCLRCGQLSTEDIPKEIHIGTAKDLQAIAYGVNKGVNYQNSAILVDADLDFSNETNYLPIGSTPETPFKGSFHGQGHHIKNLKVSNTNGETGTGLFGYVAGRTNINNLVIDSSCSFRNNAEQGTAALVGCVAAPYNTTENVELYIDKCGNEADVTGVKGVGGLVGTTLNSPFVNITNSYNTGDISGVSQTATIAGNAGTAPSVYGCWNTGNVQGATDDHGMVGYDYNNSSSLFIKGNYQLEENSSDQYASTVTLLDAYLGNIASRLNAKMQQQIWGQNIGTDVLPVFSDQGVRHERSMSNQWGTAILPFYATSDDNVQLYELKSANLESSNASITLKPVDMVEPHKPFFFRKMNDAATSVCINITSDPTYRGFGSSAPDDGSWLQTTNTAVEGWTMTGSYSALPYLTDVYFIAQNQLWWAEEPIDVPALRAYLNYNGSATNAKNISILIDDDTAINQTVNGTLSNCKWYNLNGQRVNPNTKGIIIKNGHKILNK